MVDPIDLNRNTNAKAKAKKNLTIPGGGMKTKINHLISLEGLKDKCIKCNMIGHWSHIYRTSKYFQNLYQESLKQNDKVTTVQTNLAISEDPINFTTDDFSNDDLLDYLTLLSMFF